MNDHDFVSQGRFFKKLPTNILTFDDFWEKRIAWQGQANVYFEEESNRMKTIWCSIRAFCLLTVITGVAYPALVTVVGRGLFSHQASGSMIVLNDRVIGSELIGQSFTSERYFWGRMSATAPFPYNAQASSGSNLGPNHPQLQANMLQYITQLRRYPNHGDSIPVDLITASASGLDPHISPAAASFQVPRIAAKRQLSEDQVVELVKDATEGRLWGILGEPRVNVLKLNLSLDKLERSRSDERHRETIETQEMANR